MELQGSERMQNALGLLQGVGLGLEELTPMEDDGSPPDCVCCALEEGREPREVGRSLSSRLLVLATPLLERVGEAPCSVWEALLLIAAHAWNEAVEQKREPMRRGDGLVLRMVAPSTGEATECDCGDLVGFLIEEKRELFPDDHRVVEEVLLSEDGTLWCRPKGVSGDAANAGSARLPASTRRTLDG